MGNQGSSSNKKDGRSKCPPEEPLESYLREKQRNDHLQNLGLKRHTSFRKSLTKRLKKRKRPPLPAALSQQQSSSQNDPPSSTTESITQVDTGGGSGGPNTSSNLHEPSPAIITSTCDIHEHPPPFRRSSHGNQQLTRSNSNPTLSSTSKAGDKKKSRGMDNLRKSFRASLRRKKNKDGHHSSNSDKDFVRDRTGGSGKSKVWQQDEIAVRAGTCSFDVKYLGCLEVFDSRGMPVCEEALKKLKTSKKRAIKSILYVNGDGLRVVDFETKGLLLDQTIEKVSFCAPDHNYDRGFSYICRDGTTRRWMCHGFMAIKETGDRLSHAVGCAFAICLEKKQKRDRECPVTMNFDNSSSSFTRIGSFRQATITERLADPQGIKPALEPPPIRPKSDDPETANPFAIARPHATDLMLQRQTSFREFSRLNQRTSPFKRQLSLRVSDLPSSLERKNNDASDFNNGGISNKVTSSPDPFEDLCELFKNQAFSTQQPSLFTKAEISLSTVPEDPDDSLPSPLTASPVPPLSTALSVKSEEFKSLTSTTSEPPSEAEITSNNQMFLINPDHDNIIKNNGIKTFINNFDDHHKDESITTNLNTSGNNFSLFDTENPWDLVPDQPATITKKEGTTTNISLSLSSNGLKMSSAPPLDVMSNSLKELDLEIMEEKQQNDQIKLEEIAENNQKITTTQSLPIGNNIMDDPFDAEWVSLALKQSNNQEIL